tara:strand:+ start:126 stop:560 length:435 start_codon:yes stop_codon:yes gene_type:complete
MATINTDIAQKIDIVTRQHDTFVLTLNMSTSSGTSYDLSNTYILFNIYNGESEDSQLLLSNASNESGTLFNLFVAGSKVMYDKFNIDTYTVKISDAVIINNTTGVVTISNYALPIAPGNYKYKMIVQTTTSIKTWMHGKFKVNE